MSKLPGWHEAGGDLRGRILSAGRSLFIQHGYHGLSMRQIAEAVGVSKAALYYHFVDKEQLFLAVLDEYLRQVSLLLDRIEAEEATAPARILRFIAEMLAQPADRRALIRLASQELSGLGPQARLALTEAYHSQFIGRVRGMLSAGMQRGELAEVDPNVATWALLGMMYPYFYPAHSAEVPPAGQVAELLTGLFLHGVGRR